MGRKTLLCKVLLWAVAASAGPYSRGDSGIPLDGRVEGKGVERATSADRCLCGGCASGQFDREWFWALGASNHHASLQESEELIDQQVNRIFGKLCPRWKQPITFKDWSDDWRIWDVWGLLGRDIGPRSSWSVCAGGVAAEIENGNLYFPLCIPLKIESDFTRVEAFATVALTYYPWGQPCYAEKDCGPRPSLQALREARPFLEVGTGYTYMHAHGDVRLSLPVGPRLYREQVEDDYHLWQVSPRVGLEVPVSGKSSISVMACRYLFATHNSEYGSNSVSVSFRHRFSTFRRQPQRPR